MAQNKSKMCCVGKNQVLFNKYSSISTWKFESPLSRNELHTLDLCFVPFLNLINIVMDGQGGHSSACCSWDRTGTPGRIVIKIYCISWSSLIFPDFSWSFLISHDLSWSSRLFRNIFSSPCFLLTSLQRWENLGGGFSKIKQDVFNCSSPFSAVKMKNIVQTRRHFLKD